MTLAVRPVSLMDCLFPGYMRVVTGRSSHSESMPMSTAYTFTGMVGLQRYHSRRSIPCLFRSRSRYETKEQGFQICADIIPGHCLCMRRVTSSSTHNGDIGASTSLGRNDGNVLDSGPVRCDFS